MRNGGGNSVTAIAAKLALPATTYGDARSTNDAPSATNRRTHGESEAGPATRTRTRTRTGAQGGQRARKCTRGGTDSRWRANPRPSRTWRTPCSSGTRRNADRGALAAVKWAAVSAAYTCPAAVTTAKRSTPVPPSRMPHSVRASPPLTRCRQQSIRCFPAGERRGGPPRRHDVHGMRTQPNMPRSQWRSPQWPNQLGHAVELC